MRKLLRKLRDRKGISMTEVVVAMAVVVIVTGAAISVLVASVRFNDKYNDQTYALNACESAAQCIRYADDTVKLEGYLARLGFEKVENESRYILSGSDTAVEVVIDGNVWSVTFDNELIYEAKK